MDVPEEKPHAGRPTDFKPQFVDQARKLCQFGATDQELADFFEVDVRTVYRWRNTNEEFCQACMAGKDAADDRVERSLYQRAVGYEQDEVKIFMPAGVAAPVYAKYKGKIPADVGAAMHWLKNRRGDKWRDNYGVDFHDVTRLSREEAEAELADLRSRRAASGSGA